LDLKSIIFKTCFTRGGQKNDFGFLVDRHTEYLALIQTSISYQQENEIKSYTRNLKYQIEEEFERNGIQLLEILLEMKPNS
jgi:hypothetical protein